uniref:Uncharacterized protein n=1 Tax=Oryza nivara TaxID=4536 RepID=A0A0E0ITP8_ORYNI
MAAAALRCRLAAAASPGRRFLCRRASGDQACNVRHDRALRFVPFCWTSQWIMGILDCPYRRRRR